MADRHGERVGRVVGRRRLGETEQQFDHLLHLTLVRAAIADDGTLHFGGRVLDHGAACLDGGEQRDAAGVSELEGAAGVDGVKHALDGDTFGSRLGQTVPTALGESVARRSGNASPAAAVMAPQVTRR